jgi:general secretion pathway protein D
MLLRLIPLILLLAACAPQAPKPSPGHIQADSRAIDAAIPPLATDVPYIPAPEPVTELELYTVVVDKVPVNELLFALSRDAGLNVDIHPNIKGQVTLNAVDQTLPQILRRIAQQVSLRYQVDESHLVIMPDIPHVRHYQVNYVNLDRNADNTINLETQVSASSVVGNDSENSGTNNANTNTTGGGGNNSTTIISSSSKTNFWTNLVKNIELIISDSPAAQNTQNVVANRESGLLSVRATSRQHEGVQNFIDKLMKNVQRQVLIEATVVEIRLSDQYRAGVNWSRIAGSFTYQQNAGGDLAKDSLGYYLGYSNPSSRIGDISTAISLLEEFGSVKVLSSPKIMALNNQTAILRVVDSYVYFEIDIQETDTNQGGTSQTDRKYGTKVRTVPLGLIISVTPYISENDQVMLNIRPTITRIIGEKKDPNPELRDVDNTIPIVRVREIESMLKVQSGETAIIGGLMEDASDQQKQGVPGLSKLPLVGDLFAYRSDSYEKTELAIFLRPVVIKDASLSADMKPYSVFLPNTQNSDTAPFTSLPVNGEAFYPDVIPEALLKTPGTNPDSL